MIFKLFDEGDSGGDDQNNADDKSAKGKQTPTDKDAGSQDDNRDDKSGDKSGSDDGVDYKVKYEAEKEAREKAETQYSKVQSGFTPQLQKLAEFEKAEAARKPQEDDELTIIDKRIADTRQNIALYKADKLDTMTLENDISNFEFQRGQIVERRQSRAANERWDDFEGKHPEFTDIAGLTKIIKDGARKDEVVGLETAYRIWEKDQEIAKTKESAAIDKDSKDLGNKALGQDGKPLPIKPGGEKSSATFTFYKDHYGEEKARKMLGMDK